MSESASAVDWGGLIGLAEVADEQISAEELELWKWGVIDASGRGWAKQYVHAAQSALEKREPDELLGMLRIAIPIPPFLLPAIAAVLVAQAGNVVGQAKAFTAVEDRAIRAAHDRLVEYGWMKPKRRGSASNSAAAVRYLADLRGVDKKTIQRSLGRTKTLNRD